MSGMLLDIECVSVIAGVCVYEPEQRTGLCAYPNMTPTGQVRV